MQRQKRIDRDADAESGGKRDEEGVRGEDIKTNTGIKHKNKLQVQKDEAARRCAVLINK